MKARFIIPLLVVFFIWVGWMWMTLPEDAVAATPTPEEQPAAQISPSYAEQVREREQAAYEQQTRAYQQELIDRDAARKEREKTLEEMKVQRSTISLDHQGAWAALINSNLAVFQDLRGLAAHSHGNETHCTICDGVGRMHFCILCDHNDGKCLTCRGTGRYLGNTCPTCRGTGKCYLCSGTGKMGCPFCDDGTIYANAPFPPRQFPVR